MTKNITELDKAITTFFEEREKITKKSTEDIQSNDAELDAGTISASLFIERHNEIINSYNEQLHTLEGQYTTCVDAALASAAKTVATLIASGKKSDDFKQAVKARLMMALTDDYLSRQISITQDYIDSLESLSNNNDKKSNPQLFAAEFKRLNDKTQSALVVLAEWFEKSSECVTKHFG